MRAWLVVVGAGWVLAVLFGAAPARSVSCASAVLVDGHRLLGTDVIRYPEQLPDPGRPVRAIVPACSEDTDREVRVTTFAGIPATVAVASADADSSHYVADGALVALADHPLHLAWYRDERRPSARRGRSCRGAKAVTGTTSGSARSTMITLRTPSGERLVRVDARSRIANRPAHQPVLDGQRLRVSVLRCGRQLVAQRIRFVGATVRPEPWSGRDDDGDAGVRPPVALVIAAAAVLAGCVLLVKAARV